MSFLGQGWYILRGRKLSKISGFSQVRENSSLHSASIWNKNVQQNPSRVGWKTLQPFSNLEGTRITQERTRTFNLHHIPVRYLFWTWGLHNSHTRKQCLSSEIQGQFFIAIIIYIKFYQSYQSTAPCTIWLLFFWRVGENSG